MEHVIRAFKAQPSYAAPDKEPPPAAAHAPAARAAAPAADYGGFNGAPGAPYAAGGYGAPTAQYDATWAAAGAGAYPGAAYVGYSSWQSAAQVCVFAALAAGALSRVQALAPTQVQAGLCSCGATLLAVRLPLACAWCRHSGHPVAGLGLGGLDG